MKNGLIRPCISDGPEVLDCVFSNEKHHYGPVSDCKLLTLKHAAAADTTTTTTFS